MYKGDAVCNAPPTLSAGLPTGTVSSGSVTLGVTTNKAATCRYSTAPNTAYSAMTSTFQITGSTTHTSPLTGLTNGAKTYYVRCVDTLGNVTTSDYVITFTISTTPTCPV